MLDYKCKQIIKCCINNFNDDRIINTEMLQRHINLSKLDIYYCCTELDKLGFFETFQVSIEQTVHFIPGYKLYNYKEHSKTKVKEFLVKSVLIPILVSVLASIIVTMLTLMITGILTLL